MQSQIQLGLEELFLDIWRAVNYWIISYFMTIVAILSVVIYALVTPVNFVYKLEDVGWLDKEACRNRHRRRLGKLPPVFPNGWFGLIESALVGKNEIKQVSALGENFAVLRTGDGQVQVTSAYCPHLGANIAVGGRVMGDCVQCPFHLWEFSAASGECVRIPNSKSVPKSAALKKWASMEWHDFILVWYHVEGAEPTWYPDTFKSLSYQGRNEFLVNCHIQEIPENGSDLSHFAALHEASALSGGDLRSHERLLWRFFRHNWWSCWEAGPSERRHLALATLKHYITLFGFVKTAYCTIHIKQMGPGLVGLEFQTTVGPLFLVQSVTPVEPILQKVIHRIYAPAHLSLYAKFIMLSESFMFKRDMQIWNNKMYLEQPLLLKEDSSISRYRRWFTQFYTENSRTYDEVVRGKLDW